MSTPLDVMAVSSELRQVILDQRTQASIMDNVARIYSQEIRQEFLKRIGGRMGDWLAVFYRDVEEDVYVAIRDFELVPNADAKVGPNHIVEFF